MSDECIGLVGLGFVGGAHLAVLSEFFVIETYDKFKQKESTCKSLEELCSKTRLVFVCVPTPMKKSGQCDISIVESVLQELNAANKNNVVIIKSTIPPGTTEYFNSKYTNLQIVFSPEFLREVSPVADLRQQMRTIVGGPRPATTEVCAFMKKAFPSSHIIKTSSTIAEMVKYFTNCFLMTKVLFCNEMYQICEVLDIDYDKVIEYAVYDERIGRTHLSVPGPDGHRGGGGSCFVKDLNALIYAAKQLDIDTKILDAVWSKNLDVRPEKDWEQLVGRAVVAK